MRVLMIAPTSFFSDYGGHIRILEEIRSLEDRGVEVAVVTYNKGRDVSGIDIRRTAPLPWRNEYEVGSSRHKVAFDALLALKSLREVRRFRPDLIHGHMHEGALIGGFCAKLFGLPLVFDYQGSLTAEMVDHRFLNPDGAIYPWVLRLESGITRRLPDAILTSSGHAADLLRDKFQIPGGLAHTLPDCADTVQFDPARFMHFPGVHPLREHFNISPATVVVGYLGILTDYQGIPHLIEAAADCRERGIDIHFLIMGFPNVDHYRHMAHERGVAKAVTFTGRIPFDQAPYYLSACDIAVAPKMSLSEGSGKLLNYMAMELPVAVYDTPVNREYLADLGQYAPPGDVDSLTGIIISLAADPERRGIIGRKLRHRAIEKFSWGAAAEQILKIYQDLTHA